MSSVLRRRAVASLALLLLAAGALVAVPMTAEASGSRQFYPSTSASTCAATSECRAAIEWRTSAYGPTATGETQIRRRTLFSVYAKAGEQIVLGSSSVGYNLGDALIWNPGVITDTEAATLPAVVNGGNGFSCVAQRASTANTNRGIIFTRTQELAGARSIGGTANTTGYVPCYYTAPSTGIYRVAFTGSAGFSTDTQGTETPDITPSGGTFPRTQPNIPAVSAYDLAVRPGASTSETPASEITGRVFTYVIAGFAGLNPRPTTLKVYLTTLDGYSYAVDTRRFDPNGFVLYGNRTGFQDANGAPLDHDVVAAAGTTQQVAMINSTVGGTHFAAPEYPLSFEPLSTDTLNALSIPTAAIAPDIQPVTFTGTSGSSSYLGRGGTFTFSTGSAGTYQIVISRNGTNFDPGLPVNKVLRAYVAAGSHTVTWDGTDNSLDPFPVGQNYAVRAILRVGEYHAPMIDVESAYYGSPSLTLRNPPAGLCPFTGATSTGTNCTRAFYDDRGYTTSSNVDVGTPGGSLCTSFVGLVPNPLFSDPEVGYDSMSTQRAFGTQANTNANVYCPNDGTGTLGDGKGLDLWTYFPSAARVTALSVVAIPAAPTASADSASTPVDTTVSRDAAGGVLANDTGTNITVTAHGSAAHGTLTLDADGSWSYTPSPGWSGVETIPYTITDDAGQTASSTLTITVGPVAVDDTAGTTTGTPVTVSAATLLANDSGTGLRVTSVGTPGHGTATVDANGDVTYTPAVGFSGVDRVPYTVTDASGGTASAVLVVTVTPRASADAYTARDGRALTVSAASGVLANDVGTGLRVTATTAPAHGTVAVASDGALVYTPERGFTGNDRFSYTITDAAGGTATAVVTIRVVAFDPGALASTGAAGVVPGLVGGAALLVLGLALLLLRRRRPVTD